ncbi:hypothetical protein [Paucisalibacillus globulus]|uniref:hypothetical protein n=1 Tax=Paucisalibacillus globulus TaxID=351095 RepID=UPI001C3F1365|nr:hypothetical protein [Paucisalibacillus globulus]
MVKEFLKNERKENINIEHIKTINSMRRMGLKDEIINVILNYLLLKELPLENGDDLAISLQKEEIKTAFLAMEWLKKLVVVEKPEKAWQQAKDTNEIEMADMKITSKQMKYRDLGTLYCIKDIDLYVFCLSNYSWSLTTKSKEDIDAFMKWDNNFQYDKENLIQEMKKMMDQF